MPSLPGGDLNAVATFCKVVELKSFRAAARALGIPKSTASLKVAELEARLGARLLERTTRTLRLTDAGSAYLRQVTPALESLRDAERVVEGLLAKPTGRLRVTAPFELGQHSLSRAVAEYLRRYPWMEVQVELIDRRVDLIEEGFDVAIRAGELVDSTLVARKLGEPQRFRVCASPAYLKRHGEPKAPRDLVKHACLVMTSHTQPGIWHFQGKRSLQPVHVRAHLSANSFAILRDLALAGHGIARLPNFYALPGLASKTLKAVLDEVGPPPTAFHALYPSGRNAAPKVRAFVEVLEEQFAEFFGADKK